MKSLTIAVALLVAFGGWLTAGERSDAVKTAATEIIFPHFAGGAAEIEKTPELQEALSSVPSLKFQGPLFRFSFRGPVQSVGGLTLRIEFDPAQADVGDVVKALAAIAGPEQRKNQPAAILMVRTDLREGLTSGQLDILWTELAKVAGVDVEASRQLQHSEILGIVLDKSGGARLQTIVAALRKTGAEVQDPRELD